ncbi:hypoxanthine phosphoribosyltransferase [Gemmatimonadota bacterium]
MSVNVETVRRQSGRELTRIVFTEDQIQTRVQEMAREISEFYSRDDEILVVGLLKGSFIFMADLVRGIQHPLKVDFLVVSSYGNAMKSSGDVRLLYDPEASLKGRSVILVEDIIDSGTTLTRLIPMLERREPKSLEICSLLHKRVAELEREPRWLGFDAPKEFLVGYGLDFSEELRHLPFIGSL